MATTASDRNVGTLGAVPAPPPRAGSFIEPSHDNGSGGNGRAFSRSNSASSTGSITRSLSFTRTRKFVRGDSMTLSDAHHIVESSINSYAGSLKFHAVQMILMEHFPTDDGDVEKPVPPSMPENTLTKADLKQPGAMPERLKPAITYIQNDPTPPPSPKLQPFVVATPKKPTQDERFGAFNISAPAAATNAKTTKDAKDVITKVASKKKLPASAEGKSKDRDTDGEKKAVDAQDRNVESSPFFNKGAGQGAGRPGFRRMLSRSRSLRKVTEGAEDDNKTTDKDVNNKNAPEVSGGADLKRTASHKNFPDRASIGGKSVTGNIAPGAPSPSPRVSLPLFNRKENKEVNGGTSNDSGGTAPGFFSKMSRPRADSTAGDSVDTEEVPLPKSGVARSVRKVIASFRTPRARTFLGKLRKTDNKEKSSGDGNKGNNSIANGTATGNVVDNDKKKKKKSAPVSGAPEYDRMTIFEDRPEAHPRPNANGTIDEPSQAQRRKMMPRVQSGGQLFKDTGAKIRKLTRSASAVSIGSSSSSRKEKENAQKAAPKKAPADTVTAASTEAKKKSPEKDAEGVKSTREKKKSARKSSKNVGRKKEREDSKDAIKITKTDDTAMKITAITPEEGNTTSKGEEQAVKSSKKKTEEVRSKAPEKVSDEVVSTSKKVVEKTVPKITSEGTPKVSKKTARVIPKAPEKTPEVAKAATKGTTEAPKKAVAEVEKAPKKAAEVSKAPKKVAREIRKAPEKVAEVTKAATKEAPINKKATEKVSKTPKKITDELRKTRVKAADEARKARLANGSANPTKKEAPAKEMSVPENKKSADVVRSSSRVAELRKSFLNKPEIDVRKVPKMPEVPKTTVRNPSKKKEIESKAKDVETAIVADEEVTDKTGNVHTHMVKKEKKVEEVVESKKGDAGAEAEKAPSVVANNNKAVKNKSSNGSSGWKDNSKSEMKVSTKRAPSGSDKDEIISRIISQTEAPLESRATSGLAVKTPGVSAVSAGTGLVASESRKVRMPGSGREAFLFDLPVEEVGSGHMKKKKSSSGDGNHTGTKRSKSRRGGGGLRRSTRKTKSKKTKERNEETDNAATENTNTAATPGNTPVAVQ